MGKQKRSKNTYQKINTLFRRDADGIIMPNESFTEPEFEYLAGLKWRAEEKIDGTNMRIEVAPHPIDSDFGSLLGVEYLVRFAGKTDNAQIPKQLLEHMQTKFTDDKIYESLGLKKFISVDEFAEHGWLTNGRPDATLPPMYTIYGEGYGEGIQSGGWYISDGVDFIVFDVKVNNMYLKTDSRDEIAKKLGADVVPFIGDFTIYEAINYVMHGFRSRIAQHPEVKMAEGLVLRTKLGLRNRRGERLIVKIKYEDFQKYKHRLGI